jgi:hypothetical protein
MLKLSLLTSVPLVSSDDMCQLDVPLDTIVKIQPGARCIQPEGFGRSFWVAPRTEELAPGQVRIAEKVYDSGTSFHEYSVADCECLKADNMCYWAQNKQKFESVLSRRVTLNKNGVSSNLPETGSAEVFIADPSRIKSAGPFEEGFFTIYWQPTKNSARKTTKVSCESLYLAKTREQGSVTKVVAEAPKVVDLRRLMSRL